MADEEIIGVRDALKRIADLYMKVPIEVVEEYLNEDEQEELLKCYMRVKRAYTPEQQRNNPLSSNSNTGRLY